MTQKIHHFFSRRFRCVNIVLYKKNQSSGCAYCAVNECELENKLELYQKHYLENWVLHAPLEMKEKNAQTKKQKLLNHHGIN